MVKVVCDDWKFGSVLLKSVWYWNLVGGMTDRSGIYLVCSEEYSCVGASHICSISFSKWHFCERSTRMKSACFVCVWSLCCHRARSEKWVYRDDSFIMIGFLGFWFLISLLTASQLSLYLPPCSAIIRDIFRSVRCEILRFTGKPK